MPCISFHIHYSINTHSMSVSTCRSSDNNYLSAYMVFDILVVFVHIHHIGFNLRNVDNGVINAMSTRTITIKESESFS